MTLWAIVPAKDFASAKSRLASVLSSSERAELAQSMLERVLGAAKQCDRITRTLVVTNSDQVARIARAGGAQTLRDPPALPELGRIVTEGLRAARNEGATRALVLMGDLPRVDAEDLAQVVDQLDRHDWVVVPDRHERNTNALALRLVGPLTTAFGTQHSLRAHQELASRDSLSLQVHRTPAIAFDVDTPQDYEELMRKRPTP